MLLQESYKRAQWTRILKQVVHIAPREEYCHNSKFGIFELLVWKETFEDVLLTGIVS
jgi:hypothetical protein